MGFGSEVVGERKILVPGFEVSCLKSWVGVRRRMGAMWPGLFFGGVLGGSKMASG